MSKHQGAHARHGATDVCPFVPVAGVTMEDCVEIAKRVGATWCTVVMGDLTPHLEMDYQTANAVETLKRAVGTLAALVAGPLVFREEGVAKRVVPAALMTIGVAMVLYRPT